MTNAFLWTVIYVVMGLIAGGLLTWILFPRRIARKTAADRTAAEQVEFMRNVLAFMLVAAFVSLIPLFVFKNIPSGNKEVVSYIAGQLSGMALMALGFYFVNKAGQDTLDATRAENTGKLADVASKALETGGTGEGGPVLRPGDEVVLDKAPPHHIEEELAEGPRPKGDG